MHNETRVLVTALVLLVGLGAFAGSASAQRTVYDFDDEEAWWNAYDCRAKRMILGDEDGDALADTFVNRERACVMFDDLQPADKDYIVDFITSTATNNHESVEDWWDAQDGGLTARASYCPNAQRLAAVIPIAQTDRIGSEPLYCLGLSALDEDDDARIIARINMAGMALSGIGMDDSEEEGGEEGEAPALPLVGVGLLGLLLAGRGAWLRRRA